MKKIAAVVCGLLVASLLGGCSYGGGTNHPPSTVYGGASSAALEAARTGQVVTVEQWNYKTEYLPSRPDRDGTVKVKVIRSSVRTGQIWDTEYLKIRP
ncbi:MAG: hypothetical protein EBZ48_11915 [Proteobacteria bacterium]|nr:hypothetical protein [Pseudomonadota bacterium]